MGRLRISRDTFEVSVITRVRYPQSTGDILRRKLLEFSLDGPLASGRPQASNPFNSRQFYQIMARGWSKKWARAQLKFFQAFEIGEQHPHLQDRKRARTTVEITTD
jgi:hypothetical protein